MRLRGLNDLFTKSIASAGPILAPKEINKYNHM